jgi:RNA polymerase sigma-70 factor (ECF subfamily)
MEARSNVLKERAVISKSALKPKLVDDNTIVKLACAGDVEAFGLLYQKYRNRIHALCLRMIKDPFIAEDVLQESFLCAFRRINTFRGDSLFSTWLHRIAVNAVLMHFRRCKTTPTENADADLVYDEGEPLEGERFHVEDRRLTHSVERIELEHAINSLPPGYRIMFVLHDIEGFEHSEIAAILGCTPGNTKSQLFKARRRLRELLIDLEEHSSEHYEEKVAA